MEGSIMLVLTRKRGQEIVIGKEIIIEVIWTGEDRVRLGISAPKNISIHRKEIQVKIDKEMEEHFKRQAEMEANVEYCS